MEKHGYGADHRLAVKIATRNIVQYHDPATILIDQMKEIYIDGELDAVVPEDRPKRLHGRRQPVGQRS